MEESYEEIASSISSRHIIDCTAVCTKRHGDVANRNTPAIKLRPESSNLKLILSSTGLDRWMFRTMRPAKNRFGLRYDIWVGDAATLLVSTLKVRTSQPTMKALVFAVLSHPFLKRVIPARWSFVIIGYGTEPPKTFSCYQSVTDFRRSLWPTLGGCDTRRMISARHTTCCGGFA
jgi:hypothetical protein